jgi:hypothetical protein
MKGEERITVGEGVGGLGCGFHLQEANRSPLFGVVTTPLQSQKLFFEHNGKKEQIR